MQAFVDNGTIAGAVTLFARHDRVLDVQAIGFAGLEGRRPMQKDNVFAIYSMTKPITAAAIMILQDDGKLSLDDPVETHLREFRNLRLIQEHSTNRVVLGPAPRPITIRDLLTHTSGMRGVGNVEAPRWNTSLGELVTLPGCCRPANSGTAACSARKAGPTRKRI